MWCLYPATYFLATLVLHGIIARVRPAGNRLMQYLAAGLPLGLLLLAHLARIPELGLAARLAAVFAYAFACELYIFLFTFVISSVSVALLVTKATGRAPQAEAALPPDEMVGRRLRTMIGAKLLQESDGRYAVSARGRFLLGAYRSLRGFFKHSAGLPPATSASSPVLSSQPSIWLAGIVIAGLFALPFLIAALNHFECFSFANESIAYRWGHPSRTLLGDVPPILPQGFTILALQHPLVQAIEHFMPLTSATLRPSLQLFSWGTFLILIVAFSFILIAAVRNRQMGATETLLLFVPWLAVIYATGSAGIYYCLLPDYYHPNAILACAAALGISPFCTTLANSSAPAPSLRQVAFLGIMLGLGVANKVTWVVPCLVAAGFVALVGSLRPGALLLRLLVLSGTSLVTVTCVLFAYYRFQPPLLWQGLHEWVAFMGGQQGSMAMWGPEFFQHIKLYNYDVLYPLQVLSAVLVLALTRGWRARTAALIGLLGLASLLWMVTKRPAGTTLWDMNPLTLLLMVSLVLVLNRAWARRALLAVWLIAIVGLHWRHPIIPSIYHIKASGRAATNRFEVFDEINRFAAGRPQFVMFVNNEYHHEGVYELLLKASADFPTWNVTKGRAWLARLGADITFANEYSPPVRLPPDPSGVCIVWFDRPDLPLLTSRYEDLARLACDPAYEFITLPIHGANLQEPPSVQIWIHAARRKSSEPFSSRFDQHSVPPRVAPPVKSGI